MQPTNTQIYAISKYRKHRNSFAKRHGFHACAKKDLAKTQKYWMPAGTDYAVIIDLKKKEWHFFNRSTACSTHNFSEKFVAPADLPNLEIDFEAILNEIGA